MCTCKAYENITLNCCSRLKRLEKFPHFTRLHWSRRSEIMSIRSSDVGQQGISIDNGGEHSIAVFATVRSSIHLFLILDPNVRRIPLTLTSFGRQETRELHRRFLAGAAPGKR